MKTYSPRVLLSVFLLIVGAAIIIGSLVSSYNQNQLEKYIHSQLDTQREEMYKLAELTDGNSADEIVRALVKDCGNRDEYETLLNKLNTLQKKDLLLLQSLSDSCGNFYTQQKSLMTMRFERELQNYLQLLETLSVLDSDGLVEYEADTWIELVELEKTRSDLLEEQSALQIEIINNLIQGVSVNSDTILILVKDAQHAQDLLSVLGKRIDNIRNDINH